MLYVPSTQQVEAKWLSPAWRMRILDTHTYPSDHMTPHSDDILSKSFLALEAHISPVRLKFSGAARRSTYHNSINPSPHISPYDFLCLSLARRDISCARCFFSAVSPPRMTCFYPPCCHINRSLSTQHAIINNHPANLLPDIS